MSTNSAYVPRSTGIDMRTASPSPQSRFQSYMLVLSSMSPLFILWALRGTSLMPQWAFIVICAALFLLPNLYLALMLWTVKRSKSTRTITVHSADDRRQDVISFLFAMLLPFYAVDMDTWRNFGATIAAFVIVVILFASLNLQYMNLIVAVKGYHCFQVSTPPSQHDHLPPQQFMVISKHSTLPDGRRVTGYLAMNNILVEESE